MRDLGNMSSILEGLALNRINEGKSSTKGEEIIQDIKKTFRVMSEDDLEEKLDRRPNWEALKDIKAVKAKEVRVLDDEEVGSMKSGTKIVIKKGEKLKFFTVMNGKMFFRYNEDLFEVPTEVEFFDNIAIL